MAALRNSLFAGGGLALGVLSAAAVTAAGAVGGWTAPYLATGAAAGTVLATGAFYLLTAPLRRDLNCIMTATNSYIKGELVTGIKTGGHGEAAWIKTNLAEMEASICSYLDHVSRHSDVLISAGSQIINGVDQVSAGSQNQAVKIQELLQSTQQLAARASHSSGLAGQAEQLADQTEQAAALGSRVLDQVAEGMDSMLQAITGLNKNTGKINEIMRAIADIADETNLLALNAAVEASRAGNRGLGFAVVAEEVRRLAERSARAAGEISQLITSIEKESAGTMQAVKQGLANGRQVEAAFRSIDVHIREMVASVGSLAGELHHQSASVDTILSSVEGLAAAAQQVSAAAQEAAAAVHQVSALGETFNKILGIFHLAQGGE